MAGKPASIGWIAALLGLLAAQQGSTADQPLRMQLTPAVSREPTVLTVRLRIEHDADNRAVRVVAESPTFFRSSEFQLDGRDAAPLAVVQFRNLPAGLYEVTSVLMGAHGQRATAIGLAKIEPAVGSSR